MKSKDLILIVLLIIIFAPFFIFDEAYNFLYHPDHGFNSRHVMITSFIKFALLATLGEAIGLRIKNGVYNQKGFGILPRAIVWGFLGLTIKMAFVIFATGTPVFLEKVLNIKGAVASMKGSFTWLKIFVAFSISTAMNLIFAPVMMTFHKITDTHIVDNGGTITGLFKPIKFKEIFIKLNWGVQWSFVFKLTIPLFWIPAHTITFLMPPAFRVLFAAILGIVLGVFLAIASIKGNEGKTKLY